jgi:hypothetical protein
MNILVIGKNDELIKLLIENNLINLSYNDNFKRSQDITILINQDNETINEINTYTRETKTKLICLFINNFDGMIFFDYGETYITEEVTNEIYNPIYIIKCEDNIIYCNNHNFKNTDIILIDKEYEIEVINKKSFKLKNFDYPFKNKYCYYIKKQIIINHKKYNNNNKYSILKYKDTPVLSILNNIILAVINNIHIPINQIFEWSENNNLINLKNINIYCNLNTINTLDEPETYAISICNDKLHEECFNKDIPLFECYKNNYTGHIQSIIPYKTETSINYDNTISYPLCVINHFPNEISHIKVWSKEKYIELYSLIHTINDIKIGVKKALEFFINNYYNNIVQLLHIHNSDDKKYWCDGKKCPTPIDFNIDNELHTNYIYNTVKLLMISDNMILKENIIDEIKLMNNFIIIQKNQKKEDTIEYNIKNDTHIISDDIDIDLDWIYSSNILRAINYNIPYINNYKIDLFSKNESNILNNILINISIIEINKLILNKEVNNIAIDLINLSFIKYKPLDTKFIDFNGKLLNYWIKFEYNKNSTILEFKKYYEVLLNINIIMICVDSTIIYADFINNDKDNLSNYNNKMITCISDDDLEIPQIKIKIEN